MKKLFYLLTLTGIVAISCTKTDDNEPRTNEEQRYSVSVSGEKTPLEDASPKTRVEIVDGLHHWSVNDTVGMLVFRQGFYAIMSDLMNYRGTAEELFSYSVATNIPMVGQHEEPVRIAQFSGELAFEEISLLHPDSLYDYISYYPYAKDLPKDNGWFAYFVLSYFMGLPNEAWMQSNVFPAHLTRLISLPSEGLPPLVWIDENGVTRSGEGISLNYTHYESYLRVKILSNEINNLRVNTILLGLYGGSSWIESLTIDPETGGIDVAMAGTYTAHIEGGMGVGDYIYIPINDGDYRGEFPSMAFEFTFEDGTTWSKQIHGGIAEVGKIHNVGFNIR